MLQRLMMAGAIGAALLVLWVLIVRTQSPPHALHTHALCLGALATTQWADAEAGNQLSRARLSLEAAPESLDDARRLLLAARAEWVAQSPSMGTTVPLVAGAAKVTHAIDEKLELIEHYGDQIDDLAARYAQFVQLGESLLSTRALSDATTQRSLKRLIEEVTFYRLQSAPDNRFEIEDLIDGLNALSNLPTEQLDQLSAVGLAATAVRRGSDQLMETVHRLGGVPVLDAIQHLQQQYLAHHSRQELDVARYRQVLIVYTCALLFVFGFMGWRLRRSHGALEGANAHLEETVEARTQALSKALDDLKMQQAQLIQSEKMAALGQMVAGVAHEINTPLGYVRGNVETVRDALPLILELLEAHGSGDATRLSDAVRAWPPDEGIEELGMLLNDADYGIGQISELVMGLKNFSRVDRSLTERFDLNEGVETSLKICQSQLKGRVEVQCHYGELPPVSCAPSQINQVFLNLITNAAQAIEGEGLITIRTQVEGSDAVVSIQDSGSGMDADTQAHIFEPFFTTKPVGQGTGLGLSIVFRIIEDHGGRIEVESVPGVGTTFHIRLPIGGQPSDAP